MAFNWLGALLGGGAAGAAPKEWLMGRKGGIERAPKFTDEQMQLMQQLWGQLGGAQDAGMDRILSLLSGDPEEFAKFEAPMKRQFEQDVIPAIAERFAGMGSHGAQSSSAMQQTLGQAGRELTENLAALRGNLQQNALSQLQGMMGMGMQPTFESMYRQPTMGLIPGMLQGLGSGAGQYAGMRMMGIG